MAITNQHLKFLKPLLHVLFWMLLFFLPSIVRLASTGSRLSEAMQNRIFLSNLVLIAFFYLNAYLIYPKVYKKRGWALYILSLIAAVLLFTQSTSYIEHRFFPMRRKADFERDADRVQSSKHETPPKRYKRGNVQYFSLFPYVFIIGISISYRIIRDSSRQEKARKEKENEHLKTELSFLRSQVSPHFMFNVLNTLVSLARKKSDMMEPSLIQLSHLMRYMLYESNDERISLEREVEYLRSYIDLQLLRFGDDLDIQIDIAQGLEGYEIEPMLLISFVENAFKHGIGMVPNPFIKIILDIDHSKNWLEFEVRNSMDFSGGTRDKSSGIGLVNMRRRLDLLYSGGYKLETLQNDDTFVSRLKLFLK